MVTQTHNGVDHSATALGLRFNQWTRNDLGIILNHYSVRQAIGDTNNTLMNKLNQLALERVLTRMDRLAMMRAHKAGLALPPRKPLVRARTARSTITQPIIEHPAIAHADDHYSDARDGSDVDMTDGEDAEEMPSLSDEERDLREYTATMSMPNRTGQRRSLGPRSSASTVSNRPLPTNRLLVGNRPAPVNSRASLRRSTPADTSRIGTQNQSRSNYLASSRTTKAAPTTRPPSGPSALQIIEAGKHECLVCYGSFDLAKTPMRQPTSSCVHEVDTCKSCLSASISSQLDAELWTRIRCPSLACEELLEYGDIQAFAEPQIFARYFDFTFQAAQADSHFQRCRTPGCQSGQQCFPEDTIMHCQECHHKTCITCDIEMHTGISCRERAEEHEAAQRTQELATARYIKTQAKACPRCMVPSQKISGCDHMTCNRCGHEYCWGCLADHGPINELGNHHHAPTCRHYFNNPEVTPDTVDWA